MSLSPSQRADLVSDIDCAMANAKHNSYADGYNAGVLQGRSEAARVKPGAPYRDAVRTGWNGALDKLKARLTEIAGPARSDWSVRMSAVLAELEALRSAHHEQPAPDPLMAAHRQATREETHAAMDAEIHRAYEAGQKKDEQRAEVALATQAWVQEQIKKTLDTAGAEMFWRYTDWGGRLEHLELLEKQRHKMAEAQTQSFDQRLTALESWRVGNCDLNDRLNALEQRTEGIDKHLVESVGTRLEEQKERISKLEASPPLAQYAEHARRIAQLEQGHKGLMANLESVAGELTQTLKLTDHGLGALERKVEQMEASAQAVVRAGGTEDEAYQEWSAQPWSGQYAHLNEFFGSAEGDCHRNASAAMEAGFRAGFRAARG